MKAFSPTPVWAKIHSSSTAVSHYHHWSRLSCFIGKYSLTFCFLKIKLWICFMTTTVIFTKQRNFSEDPLFQPQGGEKDALASRSPPIQLPLVWNCQGSGRQMVSYAWNHSPGRKESQKVTLCSSAQVLYGKGTFLLQPGTKQRFLLSSTTNVIIPFCLSMTQVPDP